MSKPLKVAFLGIGLMGKPMVQRLINAGYALQIWNRTSEKSAHFKQHATIARSPEEALKGANIAITMLENGDVVDRVMFQSKAYNSLAKNALVIDMSSITPSMTKSHAQTLEKNGFRYLDAPVSGGTVGAEAGTLSIMVGGKREDFNAAEPLLQRLGKPTYIGKTGCGQLTKLANQAIVGITIGAVSEALLLAAKGGADLNAVKHALGGGFAASRILELHGQRMIERNFEPGATSRVQLKDMRSILDEARLENLTLPLSQRTYEAYLSLVSSGMDNVDHSGLLLELEKLNQTSLN